MGKYQGSKANELDQLIEAGDLAKAVVVIDRRGNVLTEYDLRAMQRRREQEEVYMS